MIDFFFRRDNISAWADGDTEVVRNFERLVKAVQDDNAALTQLKRLVAALDAAVLHKTGDETAMGVKTFTDGIVADVTGNLAGNATTATDTPHAALADVATNLNLANFPTYPHDTSLALRLPLDDLPPLPDNAAGIAYQNDAAWTGWVPNTGNTVSVENGKLKITCGASNAVSAGFELSATNKYVIYRVKSLNPIIEITTWNGSVFVPLPYTLIDPYTAVCRGLVTTLGNSYVYVNFSYIGVNTCYLDYFYIGNGTYASTTRILDTSPNAKQLTLQTRAVRVDGPSGYALDTTYGGLVSASDTGLPMGSGPMTLSCWFKTSNITALNKFIICYGANIAGQTVRLIYSPTGQVAIGNSVTDVRTIATFADSIWHNVVVTIVGGSTILIYVDGVLQSVTGSVTINVVPNGLFAVGQFNGGSANLFPGQLSRPQIWSRALSAAEVRGLYKCQTPQDIAMLLPTSQLSQNAFATIPPLGSLALAIPATDVPAYPDGTAVYVQDQWLTVDGWDCFVTTGVVSAVGGALRNTYTTGAGYQTLRKPGGFSALAGQSLILRIKSNRPQSMEVKYFNGSSYVVISTIQTGDESTVFSLVFPASTSILLIQTGSSISGDVIDLDWIYIGDGTYATKVIDASKSNLRLTNIVAVPVPSVGGTGLRFNGASRLESSLLLTTSFSISCWYRTTALASTEQYLFGNFGVNWAPGGWRLYLYNGDLLINEYVNGYNAPVTNSNDGNWHHVCITYTGTMATLWFEGQQVGQTTLTLNCTQPAAIGVLYVNGGDIRYFIGDITNPLIWTGHALTDAEVLWLYANKNILPNSDGIVAIRKNTPEDGASVASVAGSITPTGDYFHVTGTAAITGIDFQGKKQLTIIPDGVFTWTAAGNIALAGTAVVNKAVIFTYDPNTVKWYPSYT